MPFRKTPDGQLLLRACVFPLVLILLFLRRRSARACGILFCHLSPANSPAAEISGARLVWSLSVNYPASIHPAETERTQLPFPPSRAPHVPHRRGCDKPLFSYVFVFRTSTTAEQCSSLPAVPSELQLLHRRLPKPQERHEGCQKTLLPETYFHQV